MIIDRGFQIGATLILLTALLLCAGCTQPTGTVTGTPTPTPTAPPATATPGPVVTANLSVNATRNMTAMKTELAALAGTFAKQVNGSVLAAAASEGPNSTAFATVLDQLRDFKASDPRLIYVYTLQQSGRIRFVVDANYGMAGGSDYLEAYPDAPAELAKPLTAPIGAGPYTDSYGTFISGYAPVNTAPNGTLFVLGVDIAV